MTCKLATNWNFYKYKESGFYINTKDQSLSYCPIFESNDAEYFFNIYFSNFNKDNNTILESIFQIKPSINNFNEEMIKCWKNTKSLKSVLLFGVEKMGIKPKICYEEEEGRVKTIIKIKDKTFNAEDTNIIESTDKCSLIALKELFPKFNIEICEKIDMKAQISYITPQKNKYKIENKEPIILFDDEEKELFSFKQNFPFQKRNRIENIIFKYPEANRKCSDFSSKNINTSEKENLADICSIKIGDDKVLNQEKFSGKFTPINVI